MKTKINIAAATIYIHMADPSRMISCPPDLEALVATVLKDNSVTKYKQEELI